MAEIFTQVGSTATEVGQAVDMAIAGNTVRLQWPRNKKQEVADQALRHALMRGEQLELAAGDNQSYFELVIAP